MGSFKTVLAQGVVCLVACSGTLEVMVGSGKILAGLADTDAVALVGAAGPS